MPWLIKPLTTKSYLLFAAAALLSACSTNAIRPQDAKATPPERVYSPLTRASLKEPNVTIVRDSGFYGSGLNIHLSLNGQKLATMDAGEKLELRLQPDTYVFGVLPSITLGSVLERSIETKIESEKKYFFRIMIEDMVGTSIQRYFP